MSLTEEILARRIVPVVVVNDASRASGLADALVAGDLPVAEVTLRTAAAPEVIATMAKKPGLLVGAGTVLTPVRSIWRWTPARRSWSAPATARPPSPAPRSGAS